MRPWIIVVSSAIGAIVVAAAVVGPELVKAPRSDFGSILPPHTAMFVVAALAVYALGAILLTTGTLVAEILFARHRLGRSSPYRTLARRDWLSAFGSIGLQRLVPMAVAEESRRGGANQSILLHGGFDAGAARKEIARLHYIWLARTHFFSALIVLTALVGLGLAQDLKSVPLPPGVIPTISAILILVGLILLALLGRIAIDVSVEPLVEAISQVPAENVEVGLLRHAVEVLEAACTAAANASAPTTTLHLPERLDAAIEQGHRALLDAVRDLAVATEAFRDMMHSSVEALTTAIGTTVAQHRSIADNGNTAASSFTELRGAVEALTTAIERSPKLPVRIDEPSLDIDQAVRQRLREPRLARELRKLLQEIEAS
jgi:hypothetical protein